MNASRPNPLNELNAALREVAAGFAELRDTLRQTNDPRLTDLFGSVLGVADVVMSMHLNNPSPTIADDLANLYSVVGSAKLKRDDPDLGDVAGLAQLRGAQGNLLADISAALGTARVIGLRPVTPDYLGASLEVARAGYEGKLEAIEKRLDEVLMLVEQKIEPLGDQNSGASNLQVGLVNFYVDSVKVEGALAKFQATVASLVDVAGLARAVETIGQLTSSLVATVKEVLEKFSAALRRAAQLVLRPVKRVISGVRTFVRNVLDNQPSIIIAEVPRSGDRWKQVNFDIDTYRNYFKVPRDVSKQVVFHHVDLEGRRGPPEYRQAVAVKSKNYRFEVGAASGLPYPSSGHPILIFDQISDSEFRYMLLMPGEEAHARIQAYLDGQPSTKGGKKRRILTRRQFGRVWRRSPLLR